MEPRSTLSPAAVWNLKNLSSSAVRGLTRLPSAGEELSYELRRDSGDFLEQRRAMAALSLVAIGAMGLVALYQMGVIKHLPQPRWSKLDSDRVDASPEAYEKVSTPDAVLGVNSYAITLALAAAGAKDRAEKQPWIPLALAAKVLFDIAQVVRMTREQWTKQKAFCFWCLISAAATVGTAALAVGETGEALRQILGRQR